MPVQEYTAEHEDDANAALSHVAPGHGADDPVTRVEGVVMTHSDEEDTYAVSPELNASQQLKDTGNLYAISRPRLLGIVLATI